MTITIKVTPEFKQWIQDIAQKKERRNLSNYIKNALLTYTEEKHGEEYPDEP